MSVAELPDFIVTSLPDWQNRFAIWALLLGAAFVLGGGGLLRRRPARLQTPADVRRANLAKQHRDPPRAPRTGWVFCAIGIAMTMFPFVNINWLIAT